MIVDPDDSELDIPRMSRRDAGLREILAGIESGHQTLDDYSDRPIYDALTEGGLAVEADCPFELKGDGCNMRRVRRMALTDAGRAELARLREWARAYAEQFEWVNLRSVPQGYEGPAEFISGPFATYAEAAAALVAGHAQKGRKRAA